MMKNPTPRGAFAGARPLIFECSKGMNEVSREHKIKVNHKPLAFLAVSGQL